MRYEAKILLMQKNLNTLSHIRIDNFQIFLDVDFYFSLKIIRASVIRLTSLKNANIWVKRFLLRHES